MFPNLPLEVAFLHSGTITVAGEKQSLPAPFNKGFTNAHLISKSFTNINGMSLPTQVSLRISYPLPGNGEDMIVLAAIEQQILNVTEVNNRITISNFAPQLHVLASVRDKRFMTPSAPKLDLVYESEKWLSDGEVQAMSVYAERKKLVPTHRPAPTLKKMGVVLATFVIVFLIALLLARRARWAKGKTEPGY